MWFEVQPCNAMNICTTCHLSIYFNELGMFRVASPTGNWFEIQTVNRAKERKKKKRLKRKQKGR